MRVGINGFGRIGRAFLRMKYELRHDDIDIVLINTPADASTNAHLLKYDSVHGRFSNDVGFSETHMRVNDDLISISNCASLQDVDWQNYNVDYIIECSGRFKTNADFDCCDGVMGVLISAPARDPDITVVYGVNHQDLNASHKVISCASCTTNCFAPIAKSLNDELGIAKGFVTTIHSYTNDQVLLDKRHKDLRRGRAGAMSMIPTSTGAASAVAKVLPELTGKIDGAAIRVPTPNVSMIDFTFLSSRTTNIDEVNSIFQLSSNKNPEVLGINRDPLVSIDFCHNSLPSIADLNETRVVDGNFVRVVGWYDNEWGYTSQLFCVLRAHASQF